MTDLPFSVVVAVLIVGTLALMGTQALPQRWPWRRTTFAVLAAVGLGCLFVGFCGLAEHAAH